MQVCKENQSGFSLIELIIVIVVVSIAVVTYASGVSSTALLVSTTGEQGEAKLLAQECAEFIVQSRRDTANGYANINNASCAFLPIPSGYSRVVTVATTSNASEPACPAGTSCKQVLVEVSRSGRILAELSTLAVSY